MSEFRYLIAVGVYLVVLVQAPYSPTVNIFVALGVSIAFIIVMTLVRVILQVLRMVMTR